MGKSSENFYDSNQKMNLIFATNNINKVREVKSLLDENFNILSLSEVKIDIDIPEPFDTLEKNAVIKAETIFKLKKINCFSEDTGLEVAALNGEPGVKSARYADDDRSFKSNIEKLLDNLKNVTNRQAQFRTVVCLIYEAKYNIFEGICKGTIIAERRGTYGFGYDSVFIPEGADKTFAEMSLKEKNTFSHRKKAIGKLILYLKDVG